MKKGGIIVLLCIICSSIPLFSRPWVGGYRVGIDGYVSPTFASEEYWSVAITTNLLPKTLYTPSMELGVVLPPIPFDGSAFFTVGVGTTLAVIHNHPLKHAMRRASAYAPSVELLWYISFEEARWSATSILVEPFTLHFSDKKVSVLGFFALYDALESSWGWGVRLFEISHYIW